MNGKDKAVVPIEAGFTDVSVSPVASRKRGRPSKAQAGDEVGSRPSGNLQC